MGITDNLNKEHIKLQEAAKTVSKLIESGNASDKLENIYKLILELEGKIYFHLIKEDDWLYPALLKHPDKKIVKSTELFLLETGGLLQNFNDYMNKWNDIGKIQNNSDKYIEETKKIIDILSYRIEKEDNEFFSHVNKL